MSLAQMINTAVKKQIETDYPHLLYPAAVRAKITKAAGEYNLKILDDNGVIDARYPEIPNVKSEQIFEVGDTVAVLLMYGQLDLYIVGKVVS
ncbi:hypothetical protein [Paenibacillus sanguinis]|uniref:hypothetical protein n=1 Tax=Paenibacillus sanguinis TaxID=225906 RepID=UPI00036D2B68|nr:hypothetical protein [Paenibacillus sanguinis]